MSRSRRSTSAAWKTPSGRCSLRQVRRSARRSSASLWTTAARICISRHGRPSLRAGCSKPTEDSRLTRQSMTARSHCSSATVWTDDYSARKWRIRGDTRTGRRAEVRAARSQRIEGSPQPRLISTFRTAYRDGGCQASDWDLHDNDEAPRGLGQGCRELFECQALHDRLTARAMV